MAFTIPRPAATVKPFELPDATEQLRNILAAQLAQERINAMRSARSEAARGHEVQVYDPKTGQYVTEHVIGKSEKERNRAALQRQQEYMIAALQQNKDFQTALNGWDNLDVARKDQRLNDAYAAAMKALPETAPSGIREMWTDYVDSILQSRRDVVTQEAKAVEDSDFLDYLWAQTKKGARRGWDALASIGDTPEELRQRNESFKKYEEELRNENAYLMDQYRRAQQGEDVWDQMSGDTGNYFNNILGELLGGNMEIAAPIVGAGLGSFFGPAGTAAGAALGGALITAPTMGWEYQQRVLDDDTLTQEQQDEALHGLGVNTARGIGALTGAVPLPVGRAANLIRGTLMRGATREAVEQQIGQQLADSAVSRAIQRGQEAALKDGAIRRFVGSSATTGAEGAIMSAAEQLGQNIGYAAETGQGDLLEGVGSAAAFGGLLGSALGPVGMARPRSNSPLVVSGEADPDYAALPPGWPQEGTGEGVNWEYGNQSQVRYPYWTDAQPALPSADIVYSQVIPDPNGLPPVAPPSGIMPSDITSLPPGTGTEPPIAQGSNATVFRDRPIQMGGATSETGVPIARDMGLSPLPATSPGEPPAVITNPAIPMGNTLVSPDAIRMGLDRAPGRVVGYPGSGTIGLPPGNLARDAARAIADQADRMQAQLTYANAYRNRPYQLESKSTGLDALVDDAHIGVAQGLVRRLRKLKSNQVDETVDAIQEAVSLGMTPQEVSAVLSAGRQKQTVDGNMKTIYRTKPLTKAARDNVEKAFDRLNAKEIAEQTELARNINAVRSMAGELVDGRADNMERTGRVPEAASSGKTTGSDSGVEAAAPAVDADSTARDAGSVAASNQSAQGRRSGGRTQPDNSTAVASTGTPEGTQPAAAEGGTERRPSTGDATQADAGPSTGAGTPPVEGGRPEARAGNETDAGGTVTPRSGTEQRDIDDAVQKLLAIRRNMKSTNPDADLLDTITTHEPPDKDLEYLAETTDAAYIDDLDNIYSAIMSEEWDCR